MARELTNAAKAAKMIRTALTAQGLHVQVKSRNFSMGNSVDVTMIDQCPEIAKLVRTYCDKFQYGHFDGMTDCYEYSNKSSNLPQAKFVHVNNHLSDAMREEIYQHIRVAWVGGDELPETYAEGMNLPFHHAWVSDCVYRLFTGAWDTFWKSRKASKTA